MLIAWYSHTSMRSTIPDACIVSVATNRLLIMKTNIICSNYISGLRNQGKIDSKILSENLTEDQSHMVVKPDILRSRRLTRLRVVLSHMVVKPEVEQAETKLRLRVVLSHMVVKLTPTMCSNC